MKEAQIIETIERLSQSQVLYGRILRDLEETKENDPEAYQETMELLESQDFKTPVDLVMYIEGQHG